MKAAIGYLCLYGGRWELTLLYKELIMTCQSRRQTFSQLLLRF